jgi:ADP-ribose pyrophosphatase
MQHPPPVDPDQGDPFTVVASRTAYQNPWIEVEHQDVLRPDGQPGVYGIVHFANRAVAILALEANGDIWLVGQWRRPTNMYSWELPEGGVPFDEDLANGAARELEEEVGLKAGQMIELMAFHPSNCVSDETGVIFLALDLTQGMRAPEPTEVLQVRRVHFMHVVDEIEQGLILDAPTQLAVLRVHLMALRGQLPSELCAALLERVSIPSDRSCTQK